MVDVRNITKNFTKRKGLFYGATSLVRAVDNVSFTVEKGKTFGLVGESGSGKTTIAKMLVGIHKPDKGAVDLGGDIDIVFQDPFGSLNPRMAIKDIVGESLYVRGYKRKDIEHRVAKTLDLVKLDGTGDANRFPHQFSGGERQRIAIARAVIRKPSVLVLDEPVSSLDVSIQASILNLLKDLQAELGITYIFISHDLRVVEFMSDTVGVMFNGQLVETASREDIYKNPQNIYTKNLLDSIPSIG